MNQETNQDSDNVAHNESQNKKWYNFTKTFFKPAVIVISTSLASILTYVLTPLNEVINSLIWNEKAEIQIISQASNIRKGDVVSVDIFIQPKSPVPLSEGLLEINYTRPILRPGAETTSLLATVTKKIDSSTRLFERPLDFIAEVPGQGEIKVSLKTKSHHFTKEIKFVVLEANGEKYPTRHDFSGTWNIDLGGIHGQMELRDTARTLAGSYSLSDASRGQIEGTRDGKTFRVTFYRGSAPSRFFIDAGFDPNPNIDLEINGHAKLLVPNGR